MIERKITVGNVIQEGVGIGFKNIGSLLVAVLLWFITFWIPYLNVGTTIALSTIPIELSKGKVVSPTFIFDSKYRRYMGEYFNLLGLMFLSILPAFFFMIIPAYVIAIGWSLAVFIMLDKGISPSEALVQSNKATYGYKWTIFFIYLIIGVVYYVLSFIFKNIPFLGVILMIALYLVYMVVSLGCSAVIYRNLTQEGTAAPVAELPSPEHPTPTAHVVEDDEISRTEE